MKILMVLVVDVDEVMYYVVEISRLILFVDYLDKNLYDYLLKFEVLVYNHLEHIEEVYDHYYQQ